MIASRATAIVLALAAATLTAAQLTYRAPAPSISGEPPAADERSVAERAAICDALRAAEPTRPAWERVDAVDSISEDARTLQCEQFGIGLEAPTRRAGTRGLACDPWTRPCSAVMPEPPDHPPREDLVLRGGLDRADRRLRRIEKRASE
jgi:hypothetical protein